MKSYLKTGSTHTSTIISEETGEIIDQNIKEFKYATNDRQTYMQLYINMLPIFIETSGSSKTVYAYILMSYNSNTTFEIASGTRALIATKYGMSTSAVANALTELKGKNLILSVGKGLYQINPRYAFRGGHSERNQALKVIMELNLEQ